MLLKLNIKNFALIDNVDINFYNGLNILTGETGAGKSILIDSVNFVLGDKQSKDIIRTGEDSAFVEAVFDTTDPELKSILSDNGIDADELIILSREMNKHGRSISRINGKTVTSSFLKQVSKYLIDIHGQHEHQSLLDESNHIKILDSFCGGEFNDIMGYYKKVYSDIKEIDKEISRLNSDEQDKLKMMDLLSFQIKEIKEADLKPEEYDELVKRKNILTNSEKIYSILSSLYEALYEGEEKESAYDKIGTSISQLESVEQFDDKLKNIKNSLEDIYYKLESIIEDTRSYRDAMEFNPDELEKIDTRLDVINRLMRKYGKSIDDILDYLDKITKQYSGIEKSEETSKELESKKAKLLIELEKTADKISLKRKSTAEKLKKLVERELKYLGMEKAIFKVEVKDAEKYHDDGKNDVFFTMSANPGEPLKPLSKVASGGEMSRIMLAIKTVIADVDKIPTLIFDEIDVGISGRTAQSVAEKMCAISKSHQLLCVTHLPQIAAMADFHFKIQKFVKNERTTTKVFELKDKERIDELARMLSGAAITDTTLNHAEEMIRLAGETKKNFKK